MGFLFVPRCNFLFDIKILNKMTKLILFMGLKSHSILWVYNIFYVVKIKIYRK